jgi:hypothetical protein
MAAAPAAAAANKTVRRVISIFTSFMQIAKSTTFFYANQRAMFKTADMDQ